MKQRKFVLVFFFVQSFFCIAVSAQQKQFKALIVTTTRGWHHESLHYGVIAIQELAKKNFFDAVLFENPNGFTDEYVKQFQVIIFLNTTGDIFDSAQQKVMERFIESGKGVVGIHSASDTEYDWDWYTKLVGRMFHIHPVVQTARLTILDPSFPGLQGFMGNKLWTDEWYEFGPEKISGLNYIMSVDESSYNPVAD
ncbi:MAG: ThuA domain-containing protein, partial [Bacteroidota bacterium]